MGLKGWGQLDGGGECMCLWCVNVCILGCAWSSRGLVAVMCVYCLAGLVVVTVVLGWL